MTRDKKILYAISISLFAILLLALFIPYSSSRYIAAILLLFAVGVTLYFVRKRQILSYNKKEVLGIVIVFALVYLMLYYLSGLYFGFHSSYSSFGTSLLQYILPNTVIIISIEIVRGILLAQRDKKVKVICFLTCVVADVLLAYSLNEVNTFNRFMDIVGLTLIPAITANYFYHYLSERYGIYPNIAFRLITTLYGYILPVVPSMPESLTALVKLLVPLIAYAFVDLLYGKRKNYAIKKKTKLSYVAMVLTIVVMISIVMLISGQFKYGALVIATDSMTGELNQGDIAIYKKYDNQFIEKGQIIVFKKDKSLVVHRVVDMENINGVMRYYTKGDANTDIDLGYVLAGDIVGLASIKLPYLGYPTVWLRMIFA